MKDFVVGCAKRYECQEVDEDSELRAVHVKFGYCLDESHLISSHLISLNPVSLPFTISHLQLRSTIQHDIDTGR